MWFFYSQQGFIETPFNSINDMITCTLCSMGYRAEIAQLGERQTEDLKVPGSIPGLGKDEEEDVL